MTLAMLGALKLIFSVSFLTIYLIFKCEDGVFSNWYKEKRAIYKIKNDYEAFNSKQWRKHLKKIYRFWGDSYGTEINEVLASYVDKKVKTKEKEKINKKIKNMNEALSKGLETEKEIKEMRDEINKFTKELKDGYYLTSYQEEIKNWVIKMNDMLEDRNEFENNENLVEVIEEVLYNFPNKRNTKMIIEAKRLQEEMINAEYAKEELKKQMVLLGRKFASEIKKKQREWEEKERIKNKQKEKRMMIGILKG